MTQGIYNSVCQSLFEHLDTTASGASTASVTLARDHNDWQKGWWVVALGPASNLAGALGSSWCAELWICNDSSNDVLSRFYQPSIQDKFFIIFDLPYTKYV